MRFGGQMQGMIQMWAGDWVITWEDDMSYIDKLLRWFCV